MWAIRDTCARYGKMVHMSRRNKKPWTLVEHLRGLGIEPEAPWHPAWDDLGNHWGGDFQREKTLTSKMLDTMKAMSLPAAPLAITLYKWAAANNVELNPFKGTVNADTRVRRAMLDYATARITASNGFFQGLDDLVRRHMEQAPLPLDFKRLLDGIFNQEMDSSNTMTAWLAPITDKLPAISTWKEMSKSLNDNYDLNGDDVQVFSGGINPIHHWSQHQRMELILAAWLDTDSRYLTMPLYNHLPNVSMENPDDVTAVFWMVATQHIDMDRKGAESKMLKSWMEQYPEYNDFVQTKRGLIESIMGDDAVVCGKMLHEFWKQRHVPEPEHPSLVGLIEP